MTAGAEEVEAAFAGVGRRTGRDALLDPLPAAALRLFGDAGPILNPWRVDEAARVLLLLVEASREHAAAAARAAELYRAGSGHERIAVLRALQLIPSDDRGLDIVRDALRANAVDLFAAAICENEYTSKRLPDPLFFQAVLKCAFVGLPLGRIERLEERTTPELSRMLFAYATEREAAGRPVSPDLWPVIALHAPGGAEARIRARLAQATDPYDKSLLELALRRAEAS